MWGLEGVGVVDIHPSSLAEGAACTDLVAVAGTAINVCIQRILRFTNLQIQFQSYIYAFTN